MNRKPLVVGNWKMNGSRAQVDAFARSLGQRAGELACDLGVCVPLVYVERLVDALAGSGVLPGAQNVAAYREPGALTGEVNGEMLADVGAAHVIVGHSERRAYFGESDEAVVAKIDVALAAGLRPIVCVGETLAERDDDRVEAVLGTQVGAVLEAFEPRDLRRMVLAYEPVWAIGTGRSATPGQAQVVHAHLRGLFQACDADLAERVPMLYGGSVKPDNARELFAGADIDGALVGGASLVADSLLAIARAA